MVRQWLTRVLDALLRIALHRWPEQLRDQAEREWRAELAEIRSEPGVPRVVRAVRSVRFTASLARSRVGADGEQWPDRVAAAGRTSRPFLLLFALPTVSIVVWSALNAYSYFQSIIPWLDLYSGTGAVIRSIGSLLVLLVLVAGMSRLGWWLGRALPVLRTGDHRLRSGLAAIAVPIVLLLGSVAIIPVLIASVADANVTWPVPAVLAALFTWTAGLIMVLHWGSRKILVGSRRLGMLVGAAGSLLVTWIAGTVALAQTAGPLGASLVSIPLWLPAAFVPPWHAEIFPGFAAPVGVPNGIANWLPTFGSVFPAFLICAAFAVGYVLQQGLAGSSPVALTPTRPDPGALRLPVVSRVAYGLVAAAVLIWADVLAVTNRSIAALAAADGGDTPEEIHLWLQEVRQVAILAVGLGLLVALRRYRWAGASAAMVAVLLLGADLVIDRTNREGWAALLFAAALAAALVLAAAQVCRRAGLAGADQANNPRRFTRIAMVAGFCAPMSLFNLNGAISPNGAPFSVIPFDLIVGTYAVGFVLVALAASSALLARSAAVTWKTLVVVVMSIALYAGIVVLARQRMVPVLVIASLNSPLPIAASFFGLARWSGWPSVRAVLGRIAVMVAALVAAVPAIMVTFGVATLVSPVLMAAAGYSYPADGVPFASGGVIVGAGVAFLLTARFRWRARRVRTRRPSVPIAGTEPA